VLLISRGKSGVSVYNPGFLWAPVSQATSHLRVYANDLRYRAVGRPDLLVVEEFEDLLERRVPNPQLVADGAEPTVQPVTATLGGGHSYGTSVARSSGGSYRLRSIDAINAFVTSLAMSSWTVRMSPQVLS
jgi:hypothetical protein